MYLQYSNQDVVQDSRISDACIEKRLLINPIPPMWTNHNIHTKALDCSNVGQSNCAHVFVLYSFVKNSQYTKEPTLGHL